MAGPSRRGDELAGRRVVVTRAAAQASTLVRMLEACGAAVVRAPCLVIEHHPEAVRRALDTAHGYDWLVLTSPNGVAALRGASLATARLAAVGPATAGAARAAGYEVALMPQSPGSASLASAMPDGPGRVLLVHGDLAENALADGLSGRGWRVDTVDGYTNRAAPADPRVASELARGVDAVTFMSGSAVRAFIAAYGAALLRAVAVVCSGPTSSEACAEAAVGAAAVASLPTVDGVVAAVVDAFVKR